MSISDAFDRATGQWTGAEWTHERVPICDHPDHGRCVPCPGCRPMPEEYCDGGESATCQTCADAERAAEEAERHGAEAMDAVMAGRWEDAIAQAELARDLERDFGDAPTWQPFLDAVMAASAARPAGEEE